MTDHEGVFLPGARIRPSARRPRAWQSDPLSEAIEGAFSNQLVTWEECRLEVLAIRAVDEAFLRAVSHDEEDDAPEWRLFLLRCHAHYRAAASLVLARQLNESMILIRAILESAVYGYRIVKSEAAFEAWRQRHDGHVNRKASKKLFVITGEQGILAEMRLEAPGVADAIERMYEHSIDFGAHPNVLGVVSSLAQARDGSSDDDRDFEYTTIDTGRVRREFVALASAGLVALAVFDVLKPGWFQRSGAGRTLRDARDRIVALRYSILESFGAP
jgi:hypothetical protein